MGASCSIDLYIKNDKGEETKSQLYSDLKNFTTTQREANKFYNGIMSLKGEELWERLQKDSNGEPTIQSLIRHGLGNLVSGIPENVLKRKYGFLSRDGGVRRVQPGTNAEALKMIENVIAFNNDPVNEGFMAKIRTRWDKGDMYVDIQPTYKYDDNKIDLIAKKKVEAYKQIQDAILATGKNIPIIRAIGEAVTSNVKLVSNTSFDPSLTMKAFLASIDLINSHRFGFSNVFDILKVSQNDLDSYLTPIVDAITEYYTHPATIDSFSQNIFGYLAESFASEFNDSLHIGDNAIIAENEFETQTDEESGVTKTTNATTSKMIKKLLTMALQGQKSGVSYVDTLIGQMLEDVTKKIRSSSIVDSTTGKFADSLMDMTKNNSFVPLESEIVKGAFDKEQNKKDSAILDKAITNATDQIKSLSHYTVELNKIFNGILDAEYRRRSIFREKKGLSEVHRNLIEVDLERMDRVLKRLSRARRSQKFSLGIFEYIKEIGERAKDYNELVKEMNKEDFSIKKKASILRDLFDFINMYDSTSKGIRQLILDGGTFAEEVIESSLKDIEYVFNVPLKGAEYEKIKNSDDEKIRNLIALKRNINTWSDSEKIKHIDEIYENAKIYLEWSIENSKQYSEDTKDQKLEKMNELIGVLDVAKEYLTMAQKDSLREKQETVASSLDAYDGIVRSLEASFRNMAKPMIVKFLEAYMDDKQKVVKFGEYLGFKKGETISVEKLLTTITSDINAYQRWFSSLTNAPDLILNLISESIKREKFLAQQEFKNFTDDVRREAILLEEAGIDNTDWMFELDENGNRTGYYVRSEYEKTVFDECMKDKFVRKTLKLLPGETYNPANYIGTENEGLVEWFTKYYNNRLAYHEAMGVVENKQYRDIMSNPAKKRFYEFFMNNYERLQNMYPPRVVQKSRIIGIKMSEKERMREANGIKGLAKGAWDGFIDSITTTYDEDMATMRVDPAGHEIKMLPIYFCNFKDEDIPTVSKDCVASLLAYAGKAYEYNRLNEVVDAIELTREILKDREIELRVGDTPFVESVNREMKRLARKMKKIAKNQETNELDEMQILKRKDEGISNASQMLNDILDASLYGRYHVREQSVNILGKNVNFGKVADFLNRRTAESALSLSLTNGLSNVTTGSIMMHIESTRWLGDKDAQRYFSNRDIDWANRTYFKDSIQIAMEVAGKSKAKKNKIVLLGELFDVQSDFVEMMSRSDWSFGTFGRMYGDLCQFMQNAGEHWMAYKTMLCLLRNKKLKDANGGDITLYDAFEVKYIDKDGNLTISDQGYGGKLVLKDGIKNEDGSEISKEDMQEMIYSLHKRMVGINHGMHGIYNTQDLAAAQRYALGRMAYFLRHWIPASINKRWAKVTYDKDVQDWREGYYRTCGRFAMQLLNDVVRGDKRMKEVWAALEPEEKANINRGLVEVTSFIIASIAASILYGMGKGPDRDKFKDDYGFRMLRYQMLRLKSELGFFVPNKQMFSEYLRIFKSPIAAINIGESALGLLKLLWIPDMWNEVDRGPFKGHSQWFKSFFGNRAIWPRLNVLIRNTVGLEEAERQYINN